MNKELTEGRIQFRSDPAKISAIQAYMAATIHDLKWDLSVGRYALWGFRQQVLANNIAAVYVTEISFKNNEIPLLKDIVNVNFIYTKKIWLDANRIQTIQGLVNLSAPFLEQISLAKNQIISVKPIRRCSFPALTSLQLKQNAIKELTSVTQWNFSHLSDLGLETALYFCNQKEILYLKPKTYPPSASQIFTQVGFLVRQFDVILRKRWPECEIRSQNGAGRRYNLVRNLVIW